MKFPLRQGRYLKDWMIGHCALTWALFGLLYGVSGNFYIACLAGLFYPLRAVLWKAPWAPGSDPNDPLADYAWGAIVPFLTVLLAFVVFG